MRIRGVVNERQLGLVPTLVPMLVPTLVLLVVLLVVLLLVVVPSLQAPRVELSFQTVMPGIWNEA